MSFSKDDWVQVSDEESYFYMAVGYVDQVLAGNEYYVTVTRPGGSVTHRFRGNQLAAQPMRENRPAELKKFRTHSPLRAACGLVNRLYYPETSPDDIYVVWFSAALHNWKALVSTNIKDNAYYEVTHNGDKGETYVDQYIKMSHQCVSDASLEPMGLV